MGKEIERKFLVDEEIWSALKPQKGVEIIQGYISKVPEKTVRVRIKGEDAFITIKGITKGVSRSEFEYPIPKEDALEMLEEFCDQKIVKTRYFVEQGNYTWEVDEFDSPQPGLVLAEIELQNENDTFSRPKWLLEEVSDQPKYFNSNMI